MKKVELDKIHMEWLISHYPDMPNGYICEYLKVKRSWLCSLASSNGLKKSKEYLSRIRRESWMLNNEHIDRQAAKKSDRPFKRFIKGISFIDMFGKERAEEIRKNNIDSIRSTRLKEFRRHILCLPMKTNLHFGRHSSGVYSYRYRMRKLGYVVRRYDTDIYYNDKTQRDFSLELKGRSLGIRFYNTMAGM